MQIISPGIISLVEHLKQLDYLKLLGVEKCCSCGMADTLHRHGYYYRKPDREANPVESLNPIKIQRFICTCCHKTYSVLPECISPRRWYLWEVQQFVVQQRLLGKTWDLISNGCGASIKTCRRWFNRLRDRFAWHADVLRNVAGSLCDVLSTSVDFKSFWQKCFNEISLARAMLLCHQAKIAIP